jgi:hypothetical protein
MGRRGATVMPTQRRGSSPPTASTANTRSRRRTAAPRASRSYWANVTSTQDRVDVQMGRPIESPDGRHAAVEFWVRMLNSGAEVTLIGILFLRFADDGRCEDLREAWFFEPGDHVPHEGWGA